MGTESLSRGQGGQSVLLTPSSGEVKEKVELYLHCSSGPSWDELFNNNNNREHLVVAVF
jgi:hypothetical protein